MAGGKETIIVSSWMGGKANSIDQRGSQSSGGNRVRFRVEGIAFKEDYDIAILLQEQQVSMGLILYEASTLACSASQGVLYLLGRKQQGIETIAKSLGNAGFPLTLSAEALRAGESLRWDSLVRRSRTLCPFSYFRILLWTVFPSNSKPYHHFFLQPKSTKDQICWSIIAWTHYQRQHLTLFLILEVAMVRLVYRWPFVCQTLRSSWPI
jgi:hypothetical protein